MTVALENKRQRQLAGTKLAKEMKSVALRNTVTVGKMLGLSPQRVRQIEANALAKLKHEDPHRNRNRR